MRGQPVRDLRIALSLLTSLFALGGFLMVYTYAGLVLDRVTGGDERILSGMFLLWGIAATVGNVLSGHLVDRFRSSQLMLAKSSTANTISIVATARIDGSIESRIPLHICRGTVL